MLCAALKCAGRFQNSGAVCSPGIAGVACSAEMPQSARLALGMCEGDEQSGFHGDTAHLAVTWRVSQCEASLLGVRRSRAWLPVCSHLVTTP